MTYLSVKSLRRSHDMGLLEPADIDRFTGYRYYDTSQVSLGQAIRRFQDLGMPLDQLQEVLHAPDASARTGRPGLLPAGRGSQGAGCLLTG